MSVSYDRFFAVNSYYFFSIMATVNLLMQTRSSFSLIILISHTCVFLPIWIGIAFPVTYPFLADLIWLALISSPTQWNLFISTRMDEATLPSVSASTIDAPPWSNPIGWIVLWSTGILAEIEFWSISKNSIPKCSTMVFLLIFCRCATWILISNI